MPEQSDSESPPPKREVLNLIDSPDERPSRRERQRREAAQHPSIEDAKKQALDLFDESDKNRGIHKTAKSGKSALPSISRLLETPDPEMVRQPVAPAPAPAEAAAPPEPEDSEGPEGNVISIKPPIIVNELAERLGLRPFQIMADLIQLQVFVAPTAAIDAEIAAKVCEKHGFVFEREKREKGAGVHKEEEVISEPPAPEAEPEDKLRLRAPIITFMGHVDHGKTSLLDFIRKSRVAAGEAGGITQHIGSYQVVHDGKPITFIDTPGHAIFTEMRARGADVTDIVVLVVAADDGVMPQTLEAISHAKAAGKTIIVAINKCDLPGANPLRAKTQLAERGLQTTDFGGDTEFVEVSAVTGQGMDQLLELMALQAEVLELRANPSGTGRAAVIEARFQPGRGPAATVIVHSGTLKAGTPFICGPYCGKIRLLINDRGEPVKAAGPATPVEVLGFEELPNVGDELVEMENERAARRLAEERQKELRAERLQTPSRARLDNLLSQVAEGGGKARLNLVLKGDVQGSVEAIRTAVSGIKSDKVAASFIHTAAGPINESDILLADSAEAVVLGFNVKVEPNAVRLAKSSGVQVKLYSIVYELIDQVREAMLGLLEPETRETVIGHAEVMQVFRLVRGRAAGCMVRDGKVNRSAHARVLRDGQPVFDGKMSTLRRFQDEVEEVKQGLECGIRLGEFNEYEAGDVIECYLLDKIAQSL